MFQHSVSSARVSFQHHVTSKPFHTYSASSSLSLPPPSEATQVSHRCFRPPENSITQCEATLCVAAPGAQWSSSILALFQNAGLGIKARMPPRDGRARSILRILNLLDTSQEYCRILADPSPSQNLVSRHTVDSHTILFHTSLFTKPYQNTLAISTQIFDQTEVKDAPSTAAYLFSRTSTMCKFTYILCGSCPTESPCRVYSLHVEYCEEHLWAYRWHKGLPVPVCLMIEMPDENKKLDYLDKCIIFKMVPGDRGVQFSRIGCDKHKFDPEDWPAIPCPYHKPGGLKERGLIVRKYRDEVERQEQKEKEIKDREEAAKNGPKCYEDLKATAKMRVEEAQRARAKQLKKEEKGCCVVQ